MSALDRAFIKAYREGSGSHAAKTVVSSHTMTDEIEGEESTVAESLANEPRQGVQQTTLSTEPAMVSLRLDIPPEFISINNLPLFRPIEVEDDSATTQETGDDQRELITSVEGEQSDESLPESGQPQILSVAESAALTETIETNEDDSSPSVETPEQTGAESETEASLLAELVQRIKKLEDFTETAISTTLTEHSPESAEDVEESKTPTNSTSAALGHADEQTKTEPMVESDATSTTPIEVEQVAPTNKSAPIIQIEATSEVWTRPAYEVDHFAWPDMCVELADRTRDYLIGTCKRVLDQSRGGANTLLVVGTRQAQGVSTFALCLARQLGEMKHRVLVIDANFHHPSLARMLGVAAQFGWDDTMTSDLSISEALIESPAEHVTILPLRAARRDAAYYGPEGLPAVLQSVRPHFDVVLLDGAPLDKYQFELPDSTQSGIDSAIILRDGREGANEEALRAARALCAAGITPIGVVDNAHTEVE